MGSKLISKAFLAERNYTELKAAAETTLQLVNNASARIS
jgi:hypothetical protein